MIRRHAESNLPQTFTACQETVIVLFGAATITVDEKIGLDLSNNCGISRCELGKTLNPLTHLICRRASAECKDTGRHAATLLDFDFNHMPLDPMKQIILILLIGLRRQSLGALLKTMAAHDTRTGMLLFQNVYRQHGVPVRFASYRPIS
jgi:hypothetical protein